MVLAGDIGGTKSSLGLFQFEGETFSLLKKKKYHTRKFSNAWTMIDEFLSPGEVPDVMCFGVAGPVQKGKVRITNVPWELDSDVISGKNNNMPVYLINDLEATAYGIGMLGEKDIRILYNPLNSIEGNIAIIAPGTGLGEAGLYWDGKAYHPFATEGGHCDFSPRTAFDNALLLHLQDVFGHVSWERVISGNGIYAIYEFLHIKMHMEIPLWVAERMLTEDPAAVISENANKALICGETMDIFIRYLATEAANLALKLKATGGVFIGGGIIPKILKLIQPDFFMESFLDFGRMKPLLQSMPVKIS